jgi:predicted alpha/beta-fold hydrolase
MSAGFSAPFWLRHAHAQTVYPALCRKPPVLQRHRERLELADGDFVDLDWLDDNISLPLVLVLHGLGRLC